MRLLRPELDSEFSDLIARLKNLKERYSPVQKSLLSPIEIVTLRRDLQYIPDRAHRLTLRLEEDSTKRFQSPDEINATIVKVYYATDRALGDETSPGIAVFENGRGGGKLTYGEAEVSIPPRHQMGWLERPSIFTFRTTTSDTKKYFVVTASTVRTLDEWRLSVRNRQQFLGTREILVFIHGYNVAFDDALMRAAQISKDLQYDGITACFS
ncbi:hypothetical protein CBA19CS42_32305 [Caballeronia novacaledonica]|uniref:Alpha/beta hydrolase n=1 Tax=Caballeronia novacaledonica TaxID=1544861 RepID=A0AA37IHE4_9BURK|nr:hypothetical protein CBA19CS42_32305 [Caballeronia novacaledonica]